MISQLNIALPVRCEKWLYQNVSNTVKSQHTRRSIP